MAALTLGGTTSPVINATTSTSSPIQTTFNALHLPNTTSLNPPMNYKAKLLGNSSDPTVQLTPHQTLTQKTHFATLPRPKQTTHKGEIALVFPKKLIQAYCEPLKFALVGKFSQGKPPLETIRKFFKSLDIVSEHFVGLLDHRHVLINFFGEKDYHRIYSKNIWYISGQPMRVFKWTPHFHVDKEPSTEPIWFNFEKHPSQYLNGDALFCIGNQFGNSLRIDKPTLEGKRPNLASLQVEIDLQKEIPNRIWLEMEEEGEGIWQYFYPAHPLPEYCNHCWKKGHSRNFCHALHPDLKSKPQKQHAAVQLQTTQVFRPKETTDHEKRPMAPQEPIRSTGVDDACMSTFPAIIMVQPQQKLPATGECSPPNPFSSPVNTLNSLPLLLCNSSSPSHAQVPEESERQQVEETINREAKIKSTEEEIGQKNDNSYNRNNLHKH